MFFTSLFYTNSLSCCTNQHMKSSYCKCFEKVEPANGKIYQISQWTVFTLAVNGGGRREGKWNKNNKSGGACCSAHYWQIRCVWLCVCVFVHACVCYVYPFRVAGVGFSGEVFCLNFQGHSTHLWVRSCWRTNEKKKWKGEERYKAALMKVTKRVFLSSVIILYSFIFAHLLCCGARGKEKGGKKGSVIPLYLKEGESEGGGTTEGQLKLMEIYNNLKLTSGCH